MDPERPQRSGWLRKHTRAEWGVTKSQTSRTPCQDLSVSPGVQRDSSTPPLYRPGQFTPSSMLQSGSLMTSSLGIRDVTSNASRLTGSKGGLSLSLPLPQPPPSLSLSNCIHAPTGPGGVSNCVSQGEPS